MEKCPVVQRSFLCALKLNGAHPHLGDSHWGTVALGWIWNLIDTALDRTDRGEQHLAAPFQLPVSLQLSSDIVSMCCHLVFYFGLHRGHYLIGREFGGAQGTWMYRLLLIIEPICCLPLRSLSFLKLGPIKKRAFNSIAAAWCQTQQKS